MTEKHDNDESVAAVQPKDYKDEAAFKKLPKAQQWQAMAERGDVRALMTEMTGSLADMVSITEVGDHLRRSLEVLAETDPTAYAKVLNTEIMATAGMLVIRARQIMVQHLRHQDELRQQRGNLGAAEEFELFAAKTMVLHAHIAKIQQVNANTQRALEQARKLRLANDKSEAKKSRTRQPTRRQRLSATRQPATAPASRLGGDSS